MADFQPIAHNAPGAPSMVPPAPIQSLPQANPQLIAPAFMGDGMPKLPQGQAAPNAGPGFAPWNVK